MFLDAVAGVTVLGLGKKAQHWDAMLLKFSARLYPKKEWRALVVHAALAAQKHMKFQRWQLSDTWEFLRTWKGKM